MRSDEVVQIPDQRTVGGGGHYQDRGQANLLPLIKGWYRVPASLFVGPLTGP